MRSKKLTITWSEGTVTGRFVDAAGPIGVLLAHGAGVGQHSEWMMAVRDGLAGAGHPILSFDYPYMEAGKRAPNRPPVLLDCHRSALTELQRRVERVVLAGKSMGGRIGSHLAAEGADTAGLVFFGYPLVGVGKSEPRDVSHLRTIDVPMLFIQGTRDRLAPLDLLRPVIDELPRAGLHVVEDGDHSYRVPKRTGRSQNEILGEVISVTADWIQGLPEIAK